MQLSPKSKPVLLIFILVILGGCAMIANSQFDDLFGIAEPQARMVVNNSAQAEFYHDEVQPIIEQRCVVCHGCYDAPCQLKLSSPQGIDRGANKELVYDGTRLLAATPQRLFVDNDSTQAWRNNGFYGVLNERQQSPALNQQASVMSRLLSLKQQHPLPAGKILPKQFNFSLDREQQCPTDVEIENYVQNYPDWGMPFGLPALSKPEDKILQDWLRNGAKMAPLPPLTDHYINQIATWENYLNGDSLKEKLVSRYLYEHWFIAHLYFSELPAGEFFKVVRSRTPPGQPIDIIATRRPYDDPGVERVYYRLWREQGSILEKTHMPYALNNDRLITFTQLFFQDNYQVEALPSYQPEVASNPFKAFEAIPSISRYKFLLEEAEFTIMNFIKSPVCRGQVALNVINDHFWVFFVNPNEKNAKDHSAFYNEQQDKLALPSAAESNAYVITNWLKYSKLQRSYMHNKATRMNTAFPNGEHLTTDQIWAGDGDNTNAALTIFRHIDSATVVKGLVGRPPQTSWVIDYGLLERIHYLLAAGFDVYGNIGHQLNTRLYMDFLRIEGEFNFLALLPPETRKAELNQWYQGVSDSQKEYLMAPHKLFSQPSGIQYQTEHPKQELYHLLKQKVNPVLVTDNNLASKSTPKSHRKALEKLQHLVGGAVTLMPQITFLSIQGKEQTHYYSVLRNNAHSNITSLLSEDENRLPEQDTITVTSGLVGAYPDVFVNVSESQLNNYVNSVSALTTKADYQKLMDNYAIRRTDPNFWQHSDAMHADNKKQHPYKAGLFDYNRLQNR